MKKTTLFSVVSGYFLAFSITATADFNNTDIYIVNKTNATIEVNQPILTQFISPGSPQGRDLVFTMIGSERTGKKLSIKPGTREKVASLGRDQGLYNQRDDKGGRASSVSFTTNQNRGHVFESRWVPTLLADMPTPSALTYNHGPFPYKGKGFMVHTYYVFPKLYHDVEIVFDPTIK